jgi:hypothetical protein
MDLHCLSEGQLNFFFSYEYVKRFDIALRVVRDES